MNRKSKVIVSIVGITIVLLALLGITYAYYLTRIQGNTNTNSISITTADLSLTYGDGTTEILTSDTLLMPGEFEGTKDFTVTNNGNVSVTYGVILEDMINPLKRPEDMKMTLSCSSNKADGGCSGLDEMNLPSTNEFLVENTIEVGETHTYELKLRYIEAGEDQSIDMGKTISGKVNIISSHDTVDMTGVVANYEEGDYVQVNSEPKISYITKDGKYKVVGLRPEQHTIAVYKKDGTLKGDRELTIKSGTSESISENEITITKDTRTITMNVTAINNDNTITTGSAALDKYNPFKTGTLAYEILDNANNVTEEEMLSGMAKYMDNPLTSPGNQVSKYLKLDQGIGDVEETMQFVYSYAGDSSKYYVAADSFTFDAENYIYTLVNSDGSSVTAVQGFSSLAGKYLLDISGSESSEIESLEGYIVYVDRVDSDNIYYTYFMSPDEITNNQRYFAYADSYEYNPDKFTYTLKNSDGSSIKKAEYKDIVSNGLIGKYIVNLEGAKSLKEASVVGDVIYKVSSNSTLDVLKYYSSNKTKIYVEQILSKTYDDYGISYYYRGAVTNNYINFAGMCWRIVRISGDGTIKLLLEDQYTTCNNNSYTGNWRIGQAAFGYDNTLKTTSGTKLLKISYLEPKPYPNSSMVKLYFDFQTNKLTDYLSYLKSGDWCLGDVVYGSETANLKTSSPLLETEINERLLSKTSYYYDAYVRLFGNQEKTPTLKCNGTILDDFKSVTYQGNEIIKSEPMYVSAITADEVVFAGGSAKSEDNENYYIINDYHKNNRPIGSIWTLTPHKYDGSEAEEWAFIITSWSTISRYEINVGNVSVRPLINLKDGIKVLQGNGTKTNPYVIE